jgi:hypothetical protein
MLTVAFGAQIDVHQLILKQEIHVKPLILKQ